MMAAFAEVSLALAREGELVGIFPEGRITDTGEIYVPPGVTHPRARSGPVITLALQGLWGSFFSQGRPGNEQAVPPRPLRPIMSSATASAAGTGDSREHGRSSHACVAAGSSRAIG